MAENGKFAWITDPGENKIELWEPVSRLVEENDVVIAEGSVRAPREDGGVLDLAFCDVFEMRDGRISRLVSYLVPAEQTQKA